MWRLTLATVVLIYVGAAGIVGAQAPTKPLAPTVARAGPHTLKGTVLLPDGKAAVGARVLVDDPRVIFDVKETTTDAAGKFALTLEGQPLGVVAALLPGHPLTMATARAGEEITIRLGAQSAALTGTVSDQHGKPVAGARVAVPMLMLREPAPAFVFLVSHATDFLLQTTTGADGRFSIPDLPPEALVFCLAVAPGLAQSMDREPVPVGHGDATITLAPEATVSGHVTRDGHGVPGVTVSCLNRTSWGLHAVTGADGAYRLQHLGSGPLLLFYSGVPDGYVAPGRGLLTLQAGEHLTGQEVSLVHGAVLSGKVTVAGTGAPVAGASVNCEMQGTGKPGGVPSYFAHTDATGVYHLRIAPGPGRLVAEGAPPEGDDWTASPETRTVNVAEGDTREGLDFTLTPPPVVQGQGRVLLPDGQPAAGAGVFLAGGGYFPKNQDNFKADAAGKFSLPLSRISRDPETTVTYAATLPGFALGWARGKPDEEVTVRLGDHPVAFSGTITDPQGQPLAGAQVSIEVGEPPNPLSLDDAFPPVTTGRDGRFSFPGLPAAASVRYDLTAPGRVRAHGRAALGQPHQQIALAPEATITGRVTAGGQPVPGAQVTCINEVREGGAATARGDGTYRLDGLAAGTYTLSVQGSGPLPEGYAAPPPAQVTLQAGAHLTGQDLALVSGVLLTGKVTEAHTGQAVPGAGVYAYSPGRGGPQKSSVNARADDHGVFRLWVAPGPWVVQAQGGEPEGSHGRVTPRNRTVEVVAGQPQEGLDFTLAPAAHVRGTVLRADGTPAAGVRVGLSDLWGQENAGWETRFPAQTGPDGSFDLELGKEYLEDPQERPLAVVAMQPDRSLVGWARVADPDVPLRISLTSGAYLTTRVSDPQGGPLAGVHVTGSWSLGEEPWPGLALPEAVSDAAGQIRIGPLPAGRVYLRVGVDDAVYAVEQFWQPTGIDVPVAAGETHALAPLHLNRAGRTVSGSVVDAEGQLVAGAVVIAELGHHPTACTDAHGRFTITGLALRGMVWLAAAHPTRPLYAELSVNADNGDRAHFTLQALGNLKGHLVDVNGKPLAGVMMELNPPSGGWWNMPELVAKLRRVAGSPLSPPAVKPAAPGDTLSPYTNADAEGRWHCDDLIAGLTYSLTVWGTASGGSWTQFPHLQVKPGETTDTGSLVFKPQPVAGSQQAGPTAKPAAKPSAPGAVGPAPKG